MRNLVDNWYNLSVFFAAIVFIVAGLGSFDAQQAVVLVSMGLMFLHFFEEFGFPGGFPWIGLHVEMGITDTDSSSWSLNTLNSLVGNWWFIVFVYAAALAFPQVRFLTLAVAVMAVLEVCMHGIGFNAALRTWYNPGLATAVMLAVVAGLYFIPTTAAGAYTLVDLLLAIAWVVANYWFVFRSPFYQWMGRKKQFAFPEDQVQKAAKYIEACRAREMKDK